MINGKKKVTGHKAGIPTSHPWAAIVMLVLFLAYATFLLNHFDQGDRSLDFFGSKLNLGEPQKEGSSESVHE